MVVPPAHTQCVSPIPIERSIKCLKNNCENAHARILKLILELREYYEPTTPLHSPRASSTGG